MTVSEARGLVRGLLERARRASRPLPELDRDEALRRIAEALRAHGRAILEANARDVASEAERGTPASRLDRLRLDESRIDAMADGLRQIADLPDPLGRSIEGWRLPNGLELRKVTVPFGTIGMVYESRPNVTVDAAGLCLKAGSAVVLRGSANALASNRAIVTAIRSGLEGVGAPPDAVQLVDSPDRECVTELLSARGLIDLVIPRGGPSLISHVVENAKVPTIETGVGNCHVYVDAHADLAKARAIVFNAKVQRPGVCNAAETLLVHQSIAGRFLPSAVGDLAAAGVELLGCERSRALDPRLGVATESDWAEEYLDLKLAVRVVDSLEMAMEHIARYGSRHSEAIVTEDRSAARRFAAEVDAAVVLTNASTRFTDGFEFGFGAEIGISTQKLHARGPMGLREIVTYKYLVDGEGQVRG